MRASLIVIGVALLFIGGIFVAIGGSPLLEDRRYRQQSARADAVATGKTLHRATETSDTAYEISYRFSPPDGRSYAQSERVPVHVWERTTVDAPLPIEYLQNDPSSARVANVQRESVALWLLIGAPLVLGGLFAITRSFRRAADETDETDATPSPPPIAVAQELSYWPLARRSSGFWVGGMFLVVGVLFFLGGSFELYRDVTFPRRASVARGIVLSKEIKRSGSRNRGSKQSKQYKATYRYIVGATTLEGRDEVTLERWRELIERERVDVLYLPHNPGSSRVTGARPWLGKAVMMVLGAIFSGIGGTFFLGSIRRARLEWRLRQGGVSTSATVVELRELPLKVNDVQQWRLNYRYQDFRGHAHDKTVTIPEDEAATWNVGGTGKVLYDPARPTEAVWLGRS